MKATQINQWAMTFVLPILLFTAGCESGGGTIIGPDPDEPEAEEVLFTITSTQVAVNSTRAVGTFKALGSIEDQGNVTDELFSPGPISRRGHVYGIKSMESDQGTIKIEFYAGLSPVGTDTLRARGGFHIVEGTGAYETLKGGGRINMEVDADASPNVIVRVLIGEARYE